MKQRMMTSGGPFLRMALVLALVWLPATSARGADVDDCAQGAREPKRHVVTVKIAPEANDLGKGSIGTAPQETDPDYKIRVAPGDTVVWHFINSSSHELSLTVGNFRAHKRAAHLQERRELIFEDSDRPITVEVPAATTKDGKTVPGEALCKRRLKDGLICHRTYEYDILEPKYMRVLLDPAIEIP